MFRASAPVKRQQWTQRLERYYGSGQTVAEFCRAEQVSIPTFYQWKRKLFGSRNSESVHPGPSARGRRPRRGRPVSSSFQPLRVVTVTPAGPSATIRLSRGIVIELGSDPRLLENVIGQVLRHASPVEGGEPC
jgi:hypothetical protein